jgi:hypothetical protein
MCWLVVKKDSIGTAKERDVCSSWLFTKLAHSLRSVNWNETAIRIERFVVRLFRVHGPNSIRSRE